MPKLSMYQRLQEACIYLNIPADLQIRLINRVMGPTQRGTRAIRKDAAWDALESEVRKVLRGLTSNVHKQPTGMRPAYMHYIDCVRGIRDAVADARGLFVKDRTDPSPHAPKVPATLDDIRRMAANRNRKTGEDGPACTSRWQTWVTRAERDAIIEQFDAAYALHQRGKGRRVTPFLTSEVVAYNIDRMSRLTAFIDRQRQVLADNYPSDNPFSTTPHHALHLCALRMAERALEVWYATNLENKYHAIDNPLPVQWTHLLTLGMRERIARVDVNPSDMSIEGLGAFYRDNGSDRTPVAEGTASE